MQSLGRPIVRLRGDGLHGPGAGGSRGCCVCSLRDGGDSRGDDDLPAVLVAFVFRSLGSDDDVSRGVLLARGAMSDGVRPDGRMPNDLLLAGCIGLPNVAV